MKDRNFSNILEDCLQRLDRGESLPDLLAEYPELTDQLKPLLLVAMASRSFPVPVPSQTAQRLGRNQMLAEMNSLEIKEAFRKKSTVPITSRWIGGLINLARSRGLNRLAYSYRLAMVSLVLVLSGGYFTISASASSQPGDLLYNLKIGLQQAGLTLSIYDEPPSEGKQPIPILPEHWEFGGYVWDLDDIYGGLQDSGNGLPDLSNKESGSLIADPQDLKAEKEAAKDLKEEEKETAAAEKEDEKDLKEEEKETAADIRESDKEEKKEDKIEKDRVKDPKIKD